MKNIQIYLIYIFDRIFEDTVWSTPRHVKCKIVLQYQPCKFHTNIKCASLRRILKQKAKPGSTECIIQIGTILTALLQQSTQYFDPYATCFWKGQQIESRCYECQHGNVSLIWTLLSTLKWYLWEFSEYFSTFSNWIVQEWRRICNLVWFSIQIYEG